MPPFSSSHSPRRPASRRTNSTRSDSTRSDSTDAETQVPPRRLKSPAERFGETAPLENSSEAQNAAQNEFSAPQNRQLTRDEMLRAETLRRNDEMARRHLPPRELQKHERPLKKREKIEAARRAARGEARHEQRAEVEREFALHARLEAPGSAPGIAKKTKKPRRRVPVLLKRLLALIALIFCVQLGIAAFSAPQFAIQAVSIEGVSTTPLGDVQNLAQKLVGQNLLRADRGSIERSVEALPTVAQARVVRLASWPPKVELNIIERQPVLKVGAGNNWWVADQNGVPFRRPASGDEALYCVVAPQFSPQLKRKLEAKTWEKAAALNAALQNDNRLSASDNRADSEVFADQIRVKGQANPAFWQLRRIYLDRDGQASLRLVGQGERAAQNELLLRLGDDRWSEKLERARVALGYFERTGRRAAELDLVSLERPVWTPRTAQIAGQTSEKTDFSQAG